MSKLYHNKISWSFNGYATEDAAQTAVDQTTDWFKRSFEDWKDWNIVAGVNQTTQGFRASMEAEKGA